ncbi:hypothetical protein BJ878DRAFT_566699 [Calycina marina]|uniref:Uncharacterized protein n=1 Tax=Calycina marina TaxID=1763456 RepID=A0A9P7Z4Y0_9HELO|nr:hypothetical protein BJ878DRAFT_566699 [Calycina marina]
MGLETLTCILKGQKFPMGEADLGSFIMYGCSIHPKLREEALINGELIDRAPDEWNNHRRGLANIFDNHVLSGDFLNNFYAPVGTTIIMERGDLEGIILHGNGSQQAQASAVAVAAAAAAAAQGRMQSHPWFRNVQGARGAFAKTKAFVRTHSHMPLRRKLRARTSKDGTSSGDLTKESENCRNAPKVAEEKRAQADDPPGKAVAFTSASDLNKTMRSSILNGIDLTNSKKEHKKKKKKKKRGLKQDQIATNTGDAVKEATATENPHTSQPASEKKHG